MELLLGVVPSVIEVEYEAMTIASSKRELDAYESYAVELAPTGTLEGPLHS